MNLSQTLPAAVLLLAAVGHAQWTENFDSYSAGPINGQGGWELWSATADGYVDTAQARSGANSLRVGQNPGALEADVVHQYYLAGTNPQYASGQWVYRAYQYIPSTMTGTTYFIMMSDYSPTGPYVWAVQVEFTTSLLQIDAGGSNNGSAPVITDQWVELRVHIDLDADTTEFFYNGSQVGPTYAWTGGPFGGSAGLPWIAAVDIYANDASDCYYDDFELYEMVHEIHNPGCDSSVGPIGVTLQVPPSLALGVYAAEFTNMPQPFCFHAYGTSKEMFLGTPLPIDLGIAGAPGCQWHTSADATSVLVSTTPAPGPYSVTTTLPIPNLPVLEGLRFYHQALAYDPGQNPLELVSSPAVSIVIQP